MKLQQYVVFSKTEKTKKSNFYKNQCFLFFCFFVFLQNPKKKQKKQKTQKTSFLEKNDFFVFLFLQNHAYANGLVFFFFFEICFFPKPFKTTRKRNLSFLMVLNGFWKKQIFKKKKNKQNYSISCILLNKKFAKTSFSLK